MKQEEVQNQFKNSNLFNRLGCFKFGDAAINLNHEKNEFTISQPDQLTKTIKFCDGFQMITINCPIPLPTQMQNEIVREDIMYTISNLINCSDCNLQMILMENQNNEHYSQFKLRYAITIENEFELPSQLDDIIFDISDNIEIISTNAYNNGDQDLEEKISELLQRYSKIL